MSNGTPTSPARTGWDAFIVASTLVTILAITVIAIFTYGQNVTSVTTILAAVIPAIAAIGAAAFGVTYAAKASTEASQARAAQANAERETQETKQDTQTIATYLAPLKDHMENISANVQLLPSPTGRRSFIMPETEDDFRELRQAVVEKREIKPISMQTLDSAKEQIAKIEAMLERINSR